MNGGTPAATIRPYAATDATVLYEICLRTGKDGGDATGHYLDPLLLGHVYLGAYLALAPELAFVLDRGDGLPVGYVVGAADTEDFTRRCEQSWWPPLRASYPDPAAGEHPPPPEEYTPDQRLAALIHRPPVTAPAVTARYPSHLHIDLLPAAQGHGHGRALMLRMFEALRAGGSAGVHLGVARANTGAIGFYRRLGFVVLEESPGGLVFGLPL